MKILLVGPLFPPDKGVSTFRMKFFYDQLSQRHQVDVLKPGEQDDWSGPVKTINRRYFSPFVKAVFNRRTILNAVREQLVKYDLVIVSAVPFGLYEVAHAARQLNIPYIIDLRDLPDLTTSEQRGRKSRLWLDAKAAMIFSYIRSTAKNARALMCVGAISTAIMQQRLRDLSCRVLNVHNGFEEKDVDLVLQTHASAQRPPRSGELVLACVGNIFRFRDTLSLRDTLARLNQRSDKVVLKHWGKVEPELEQYLRQFNNLEYLPCPPVSREVLLNEMHAVDAFLLPCADDLIWEPTTSVFDYILFGKPVIYTGLPNNEAFTILHNTRTPIVESADVVTFDFKAHVAQPRRIDDVRMYCREFYIDRLFAEIGRLERK